MNYIMSFDVGTSSLKAVLIDSQGRIVGTESGNYQLSFGGQNEVEFNPLDHWNAICAASKSIMSKSNVPAKDVAGLVFITQSQNVIALDSNCNLIRPGISWMDGRADKEAHEIVAAIGGEEACKKIAGAVYTGLDILPKVRWIAKNEPDNFAKMKYFVDCNGYLTYKATGRIVCDVSTASISGYDNELGEMNRAVLEVTGFSSDAFPKIINAYDFVGNLTTEAAELMGLTVNTKVFGGTFDVLGAAVGTGMVDENEAHIYMGTSGWTGIINKEKALLNNGGLEIISANPNTFLRCYSQNTCCANFEWFLEKMYPYERATMATSEFYDYINKMAESVPAGANGVIFNPWLCGERSPIPDVSLRGGFLNIQLTSTREDLLRAVMEGIAYNIKWSYDSMEDDLNYKSPKIRIMGGATNSAVWMQIFADLFGRDVEIVADSQNAGAIGGGFIAAMGLGIVNDWNEIKDWVRIRDVYKPNHSNMDIYSERYAMFKESYEAVKSIYNNWNDI